MAKIRSIADDSDKYFAKLDELQVDIGHENEKYKMGGINSLHEKCPGMLCGRNARCMGDGFWVLYLRPAGSADDAPKVATKKCQSHCKLQQWVKDQFDEKAFAFKPGSALAAFAPPADHDFRYISIKQNLESWEKDLRDFLAKIEAIPHSA